MSRRARYALVGTGARAALFIDAITGPYAETTELVALCDLSQARMDWYNRQLGARTGAAPRPTYGADAFDRMIWDTRPDTHCRWYPCSSFSSPSSGTWSSASAPPG